MIRLYLTAIVFWVYLVREACRYQIRPWWALIVATLVAGPSFALPLFLAVRELRVNRVVAPS